MAYQRYYKERPITFLNERNMEIYRLYTEEGMIVKEISRKFNLGIPRVYNVIRKMRHALSEAERLQNPTSDFEKIEVLLHPNSLVINCLKDECVETISDLRELIKKIDEYQYGIPKLGERSIRKIREALKALDSQ